MLLGDQEGGILGDQNTKNAQSSYMKTPAHQSMACHSFDRQGLTCYRSFRTRSLRSK